MRSFLPRLPPSNGLCAVPPGGKFTRLVHFQGLAIGSKDLGKDMLQEPKMRRTACLVATLLASATAWTPAASNLPPSAALRPGAWSTSKFHVHVRSKCLLRSANNLWTMVQAPVKPGTTPATVTSKAEIASPVRADNSMLVHNKPETKSVEHVVPLKRRKRVSHVMYADPFSRAPSGGDVTSVWVRLCLSSPRNGALHIACAFPAHAWIVLRSTDIAAGVCGRKSSRP